MKVIRILILCLIAFLITMSTVHAQVSFIVSSPKAGDSWKLGETKNIQWSYSSPQAVPQNWKLVLMKGSTVVGTIADNVSGSSYSWRVGQYIGGNATPGTDYKIQITHVTSTQISNNSGVFSILFSSVAQKITAPTQPPIHRTFDPKQKLRELQAAEDRKRVSRQLSLKTEITKLVQKDIEIKKTKKKVEICTSPKIFSVSGREVYPGDPIYIRGCGFGISKGSVIISHLFPLKDRQLEIETWVDGGIVGRIPNITGFADPKPITLKVTTASGQASDPYSSLTLKPNIDIFSLERTGETIAPGGPSDKCLIQTVGSMVIHYNFTQQCQGIDTICEAKQLKNNWTFYHLPKSVKCLEYNENLGSWWVVGCTANEWANPVQNYDAWVGKSSIPKIEFSWGCGSNKAISYYPKIFIAGPAGTEYQ